MKLTIDVTQDDITLGCEKDLFGCMVARAATRALGVSVGTDSLTLFAYDHDAVKGYAAGNDISDDLPVWVSQRISDFDEGKEVEPFTFEVELLPEFAETLAVPA